MVLIMVYKIIEAVGKFASVEAAAYYGAINLPEKLYSIEPIRDAANHISTQIPNLDLNDVLSLGVLGLGTLVGALWGLRHVTNEPRKYQPRQIFPEEKPSEPLSVPYKVWIHTDDARQFDRGGLNNPNR